MWITKDEAVDMYARFFAARFGAVASRVARETAAKLHLKGDSEGHVVWSRVADAVERRFL